MDAKMEALEHEINVAASIWLDCSAALVDALHRETEAKVRLTSLMRSRRAAEQSEETKR